MPVELSVRRSAAVRAVRFDSRALRDAMVRALAAVRHEESELSMVLADDAFVRPLNAEWRGVDAPTDVLSFPQEDLVAGSEGGPALLGDVVISVQTAARQAEELGHDVLTELVVLAVHGLLHLLGYDHERDEEGAAQMAAEEARVLAAVGVEPQAALIARAR